MKKYPVMFKLNTNGKTINQWQICVDGDRFFTIEGLQNGALTTSKPTICKGKNIGRANETTDAEQAISEAESKIQKKKDKGYTEDITKVSTCKTTFSPMLAFTYEDYIGKVQFPVLCSRKIDGLRYVAQASGGFTRNGKPYVSVTHIQQMLAPVFEAHPEWIIDGEIYSEDVPFEEVVSLVKKQKPDAAELAESEVKCKLYLFDGVIDDVNAGFETRFDAIRKEIIRLVGNTKYIVWVKNEVANSHDELIELHDKYVAEGWEGIMLRKMGSPYENKRSKNLMKHKNFKDAEYKIVDIVEGIGSRAGMAGKLVVLLEDGTTCESGIRGNEAYYTTLLKNRKKLIGKKATIRYQGFTEAGKLRFPVATAIDPIDR